MFFFFLSLRTERVWEVRSPVARYLLAGYKIVPSKVPEPSSLETLALWGVPFPLGVDLIMFWPSAGYLGQIIVLVRSGWQNCKDMTKIKAFQGSHFLHDFCLDSILLHPLTGAQPAFRCLFSEIKFLVFTFFFFPTKSSSYQV